LAAVRAPHRIDLISAWHLRTALGDGLWYSEAGIPLADHRHHRSGPVILPRASRCSASTPEAPPAA